MFNEIFTAVLNMVLGEEDQKYNYPPILYSIATIGRTTNLFTLEDGKLRNWQYIRFEEINKSAILLNIDTDGQMTDLMRDFALFNGELTEVYMFDFPRTEEDREIFVKNSVYCVNALCFHLISTVETCVKRNFDTTYSGVPSTFDNLIAYSAIMIPYIICDDLGEEFKKELINLYDKNLVDIVISKEAYDEMDKAFDEVEYDVTQLFDNSMLFAFNKEKYPNLFFLEKKEEGDVVKEYAKQMMFGKINIEDVPTEYTGAVIDVINELVKIYGNMVVHTGSIEQVPDGIRNNVIEYIQNILDTTNPDNAENKVSEEIKEEAFDAFDTSVDEKRDIIPREDTEVVDISKEV